MFGSPNVGAVRSAAASEKPDVLVRTLDASSQPAGHQHPPSLIYYKDSPVPYSMQAQLASTFVYDVALDTTKEML